MRFLPFLSCLLACSGNNIVGAFQNGRLPTRNWMSRHYDDCTGTTSKYHPGAKSMTSSARSYREERPYHFLMEEFTTHAGEVVDPYETLKVRRDANRDEIRKSYIALSRRYHPDGPHGVRHNAVLPGKCNSLDEVREEWERIKLSYEILSDKKSRKKYDRHALIADPKGAMGRAAIDALGKGLVGIGQGLFSVGSFALDKMSKEKPANEA